MVVQMVPLIHPRLRLKGAREAARYLVDCSRRASETAVPVCHLYGSVW